MHFTYLTDIAHSLTASVEKPVQLLANANLQKSQTPAKNLVHS